ncbi:hypothetical protein F5Y14DRAFT_271065 [Nemania sp. NC0429]|nr:hypothetical protein F5Y14DRAFT_271065 [Nemania sp. NC0429]
MASPIVALINRVPTPSPMHLDSNPDPEQSIHAAAVTPSKRKRESSQDGDDDDDDRPSKGVRSDSAGPSSANAPSSSSHISDFSKRPKTSAETLRNYYLLLERLDPSPSILKRPLPELDPNSEPHAKRQKSVPDTSQSSIAEKVARDDYDRVDAIVADLASSIADQLTELRALQAGEDSAARDSAIARVLDFKKHAHGLFMRELSYPHPSQRLEVLDSLDPINDLQSDATGHVMLSVFGEAPRPRQLYSSLQLSAEATANATRSLRPLREIGLPNGVKVTKVVPYSFPPPVDKDKKSKTLGELFPAPRTLPSLPPPKAPKSTTKGVQVGWHRPELTEKSKYRAGSYFGQPLSTGRWLDYSNASPASQTMTKQRERALSLAGNKPSSLELETSELESLFRGAFSSFAPSKDDSAAMVSSGLISHTLWWQKVGQRSFDRLVHSERADHVVDKNDEMKIDPKDEIDEQVIQQAIDDWDDSVIDPSLEEACCPQKSDAEKDVDDILQDVSDMIQTLISYQKNRNLTLPTASSQSRYASDPAHSDMLTNGTQAQPGEEETATYETLRAQLVLVIQMLPPYAVARLNSDKLEELSISTRMEIRTDEYQGTMEEDEVAARARAAQTAATANARPISHRPSASSGGMQYGQPYHQNAARAPTQTQFYATQTPARPPQPAMQRAPQTMPPTYQQRPPTNTGYRPPNSYQNTGYPQQYAKPAPGYAQASYASTPAPSRSVYSTTPNSKYVPGYSALGHLGNNTSQPRFQAYTHPPNTQPHFTHQPYQPHQSPAPTPSHAPYGHYTNGAAAMPQRTTTASPHMHHQQPHSPHVPPQGYHPAGTPSRQPSYNQPHMANNAPRPYYPASATHVPPPMQNQHHNPNQPSLAPGTPFQTSLSSHQVQQAMDQAKARFNAQQTAHKSNEGFGNAVSGQTPTSAHAGSPVGLSGIGLGANSAQMSAVRSGKPNGVTFPQASSQPHANSPGMTSIPPLMNGGTIPHGPPTANGTTIPPTGKGA